MNVKVKRVMLQAGVVVYIAMQTVPVVYGITVPEKWTPQEMEKYKIQITEGNRENENLYKLVLLTRGVMSGYSTGDALKYIDGVDEYAFLYPIYLGLPQMSKTSYSMGFKDIYKENIENKVKTKGYKGLYNLEQGIKLEHIGMPELEREIKARYPRTQEIEDTLYVPYANAIAISDVYKNAQRGKYEEIIERKKMELQTRGIKESYPKMKRHMKVILALTEGFDGMTDEELEQVLDYNIELWYHSSKEDKTRGFENYSYGRGINYTEQYRIRSIYGRDTVEEYMEDAEAVSPGDILHQGKRMGKPLMEWLSEQGIREKVKVDIINKKESMDKNAIEMYNRGIGVYLSGQQTMDGLRGIIEVEQERERQEEQRKQEEARLLAERKAKEEEELKRKQRMQQVSRGARKTDGVGIKKLITTGKIYKPYKLVNKGREKIVDITYFVQTHGGWENEKIRDEGEYQNTYGRASCGYTSMSMIISSINEDSEYTPLDIKPTLQEKVSGNNIVVPHQGYNHGGMDWYIKNIGLKREVTTSKNGITYGSGTMITRDNVRNLIDNGGIGIISTSKGSPYTGGGHIVLLVGYTVDEKGEFQDIIIQDSNLILNLDGRFSGVFRERVRVDGKTGLVYDNFMRGYKSIPVNQMRYASAVFPGKIKK